MGVAMSGSTIAIICDGDQRVYIQDRYAMTCEAVIKAVRKQLARDLSFQEVPTFGSGVRWERAPYTAELSRDYKQELWKEFPAVRVMLKEYGRKDREATFLVSETNVVDKVTHYISQHMHGPRDLS